MNLAESRICKGISHLGQSAAGGAADVLQVGGDGRLHLADSGERPQAVAPAGHCATLAGAGR